MIRVSHIEGLDGMEEAGYKEGREGKIWCKLRLGRNGVMINSNYRRSVVKKSY